MGSSRSCFELDEITFFLKTSISPLLLSHDEQACIATFSDRYLFILPSANIFISFGEINR